MTHIFQKGRGGREVQGRPSRLAVDIYDWLEVGLTNRLEVELMGSSERWTLKNGGRLTTQTGERREVEILATSLILVCTATSF